MLNAPPLCRTFVLRLGLQCVNVMFEACSMLGRTNYTPAGSTYEGNLAERAVARIGDIAVWKSRDLGGQEHCVVIPTVFGVFSVKMKYYVRFPVFFTALFL